VILAVCFGSANWNTGDWELTTGNFRLKAEATERCELEAGSGKLKKAEERSSPAFSR